MGRPDEFQKIAFTWACQAARAMGMTWEDNLDGSIDLETTPGGWKTAETAREFVALVSHENAVRAERARGAA